MENNSGVYRILNTKNGRKYIGSSKNLKKRLWEHRNKLNKNEHENSYLQNAWNLYGEGSFEFIVLIYCKPEENLENEQRLMDITRSHKDLFGYNINPVAGSNLGYVPTQETKDKIAKARTGQKMKPETIEKMRQINLGKRHTPEARARMSKAQKGVPKMSDEQKAAVSAFWKGTTQTQETIDKRRASRKITEDKRREAGIKRTAWNVGIPMSEEQKEKLRAINTGIVRSEEFKEKQRIVQTGKKMSPEAIAKSVGTRRANKLKKAREIWWADQSVMFEAQALLQNTNFNI